MRRDLRGVSGYFAVHRKKQNELFIPTLAQSLSKWALKEAVVEVGLLRLLFKFSQAHPK